MTLRIKRPSPSRDKRAKASDAKLRVVMPVDDLTLGHRLDNRATSPAERPTKMSAADMQATLRRLRDLVLASEHKATPPQGREQVDGAYLLLLDEIKGLGDSDEATPSPMMTTLRVQRHIEAVNQCLTMALPTTMPSQAASPQAARLRALESVNQLRVHLQNVSSASLIPRDCDFALEAAKLTAWYIAPSAGTTLLPSEEVKNCAALSLLR